MTRRACTGTLLAGLAMLGGLVWGRRVVGAPEMADFKKTVPPARKRKNCTGQGIDHVCTTSAQLVTALAAANPCDTITLTAGSTYDTASGFTLGNRGATAAQPITIRTSGHATLPLRRMTAADASLMPRLRSTASNTPVFSTAVNADGWKFVGLEVTATAAQQNGLVEFGSTAETTLANQPDGIVVDRCYIHGVNDLNVRRGISAQTQDFTLTRSEISQIWETGQECQAVWMCNGPGPFLVEDNLLSAMGQCMMSGGADPAITNLVPSDFTIRYNLFSCPLEKNVNHPSYDSRDYNHKNVFELKNAHRALIEYNIFEHAWVDGQDGTGFLLTPRNQSGTAPWSGLEDITIQYNVLRHMVIGMSVIAKDNEAPGPGVSDYTKRVVIRHNLFYDLNWAYGGTTGNKGVLVSLGGHPDIPGDRHGIDTLTIEHNTFDGVAQAVRMLNFSGGDGVSDSNKHSSVTIRNNISKFRSDGLAIDRDGDGIGTAALNASCQAGYVCTNNLFFGGDVAQLDLSAYPANNWEEATGATDVGFDDYASNLYELTAAGTGGDYRAGGSRDATDGTALGVAWAQVVGLL